MEEQIGRDPGPRGEAERLDRCMSMVAHHEEVQVIVAVIQKLLAEWKQAAELPEEGDRC